MNAKVSPEPATQKEDPGRNHINEEGSLDVETATSGQEPELPQLETYEALETLADNADEVGSKLEWLFDYILPTTDFNLPKAIIRVSGRTVTACRVNIFLAIFERFHVGDPDCCYL